MENNDSLNELEKLKAENDFLKMKMMLEHGADFYMSGEDNKELDPEIENQFTRIAGTISWIESVADLRSACGKLSER